MFYNPFTKKCEFEDCNPSKKLCSKCFKNECVQCLENSFFNNNNECSCEKNHYYNKKLNKCLPEKCLFNVPLCIKCNIKGKCLECKQGSFYNEIFNVCICYSDFYHDLITDVCVQNKENSSLVILSKKLCYENSYLDEILNKCICKNGYIYDNYLKKCIVKIQLCQEVNQETCIKCKPNSYYIQNFNTCDCNYGFKLNSKEDFCESIY